MSVEVAVQTMFAWWRCYCSTNCVRIVALLLLHVWCYEKATKREMPVEAAEQTVPAWWRCYCCMFGVMKKPLNARCRWKLLNRPYPHGGAVTAWRCYCNTNCDRMVVLLLLHAWGSEEAAKREVPVEAAEQTVSAWWRCYCSTNCVRIVALLLLHVWCYEKAAKREMPVEAAEQTVPAWWRCYCCMFGVMKKPLNARCRWKLLNRPCPHGGAVTAVQTVSA
ncbi:hypothetical protein Bbelb_307520 [Branchiostoma belcheri]|nr:hypothetical protein Bbelb_307520 [Branchiostoma belcheri]